MKYFRFLFLLLLFPLLMASSSHKFYVSITKIEFVAEKNSVQIITKIFTDDMETALQKRYSREVSLGTTRQTEADLELLQRYVLQKLKIRINGNEQKLKYIGQEYELDMLISYIEIPDVKALKSIEIENSILMDVYPEQQNIVHVKTGETRRSLILDSDAPKGSLAFD